MPKWGSQIAWAIGLTCKQKVLYPCFQEIIFMNICICFDIEQINEQASDEVLGIEQKYNDVRRPVYTKRTDIIKSIPDFWLTAESVLFTL